MVSAELVDCLTLRRYFIGTAIPMFTYEVVLTECEIPHLHSTPNNR